MERNCKKLVTALLICLLVAVTTANRAFADAASDARIEKLEIALKQLQTELAELKAERQTEKQVSEKLIETGVTKVLENKEPVAQDAVAQVPAWLNKLSFGGDFRYRHETADTYADTDWQKGRSRHRFRARFKLGVEVNDELDAKFRFVSGTADPVSSNQTLDNSFSTKDFLLDWAYLDWHPASIEGLNVYAGKMKMPFYVPLKTKLIWDDNISPEGGAISYVRDLDDSTKIYFTGAGFWVDEDSAGVDTSLWGAQSYIKKQLEGKRYAIGGVSYYDYGNIKNRGSLESTWSTGDSFFGNTIANRGGNEVYADDYNLFELFGEFGFQAWGMPIAVAGDW
ncbi:MAG: putative porin, partial [Phycisphaerae bacterium]|nr:putative porin [Phycisphaerae bacterium]